MPDLIVCARARQQRRPKARSCPILLRWCQRPQHKEKPSIRSCMSRARHGGLLPICCKGRHPCRHGEVVVREPECVSPARGYLMGNQRDRRALAVRWRMYVPASLPRMQRPCPLRLAAASLSGCHVFLVRMPTVRCPWCANSRSTVSAARPCALQAWHAPSEACPCTAVRMLDEHPTKAAHTQRATRGHSARWVFFHRL